MHKYTVYDGQFICYTCKEVVDKARLWKDTLDLTWRCNNKHTSKVNLSVKGY